MFLFRNFLWQVGVKGIDLLLLCRVRLAGCLLATDEAVLPGGWWTHRRTTRSAVLGAKRWQERIEKQTSGQQRFPLLGCDPA